MIISRENAGEVTEEAKCSFAVSRKGVGSVSILHQFCWCWLHKICSSIRGKLRCCKDVYVNSFFPRTARLWNSLPIECFPLTYDLSGFKCRINISFNCRFFLNKFPLCFNLFVLLFLVTPCLVVAVQPCME